jgi:polyphosphate kinase
VIKGLWIFREVKVFAFSATSSASYERFIGNCIGNPKVLAFKSEYEQVHDKSPIVDAKVVTAADEKQLLSLLE